MGLSDKDKRIIESVENNEFVDDIDINNMKFIYSKDFYVMMAKLLKKWQITSRSLYCAWF